MIVERPEMQWNPAMGESNEVVTAALLLCCILAELKTAAKYDTHPKLAEVWMYLRNTTEDAQDLWKMRYEALMQQTGV